VKRGGVLGAPQSPRYPTPRDRDRCGRRWAQGVRTRPASPVTFQTGRPGCEHVRLSLYRDYLMLRAVSAWIGAMRGALLGTFWASALLSLLALVKTMPWAPHTNALLTTLFGPPKAHPTVPVGLLFLCIAVAAVVGAGLGSIAVRITGTARRRLRAILILSIPALYFYMLVMVIVNGALEAAGKGLDQLLALPFMAVFGAIVGAVMVVPVAGLPLGLAALMLEGWTRPESLGQGGMANPGVRRWSLGLVAFVAVTLAVSAASRWPT
jgi:hypothetical protein